MSIEDTVRSIVEPLADDEMVELVDVEQKGGTLRITVDQSPDGIGTEALARITRAISRAMDEHDPVAGQYTLEISSPGLERSLRTADHFTRAIGELVKVKTTTEVAGQRRFLGELREVAENEIVLELDEPLTPSEASEAQEAEAVELVEVVRIHIDSIAKARTVFDWGPAPKPGSPEARKQAAKKKKKSQRNKQAGSASEPDPSDGSSGEQNETTGNSAQTSETTGAVGS